MLNTLKTVNAFSSIQKGKEVKSTMDTLSKKFILLFYKYKRNSHNNNILTQF